MVTMQEIICGDCAQREKPPLEERVNIALSIRRGETYLCKLCLSLKLLPLNRSQIPVATIEEEVTEPVPTSINNLEPRIPSQLIEQILLFD